jgi:SAM-dependent methyltransferase
MVRMDIFAQFKAAQRAGWSHFTPLQAITTAPASRLVRHARIAAGQRVLDVACGTGVVAVTAARAGARVTGLDLTPELLREARHSAELASVDITWHEGDVEAMPFEDGIFDVVVSQFGHMFAPRPAVAVGEMLRVLKPGGTIAFSTWPPELLVGRVFGVVAKYLPPLPPEIAPPPQWGEPTIIRERLAGKVRDVLFDRGRVDVPTLSVGHYRDMMERTAGPVIRLVETLGPSDPGRLAEFRRDLEALAAEYLEGNLVRQDYLMTRATKI